MSLLSVVGLIMVGLPGSAYAAPSPTPIRSQPVQPQVTWPPGNIEIAAGLTLPWDLVQLGDGSVLFTISDSGEIKHATGVGQVRTVGRVPGIDPSGEGGLLGLVQDPQNPSILYTYASKVGQNQVLRLTWDGSTITVGQAIVTGIPQASRHDGGRLAFGPDNQLYVTTGDAGRSELAQDLRSLGGKILRVDRTGAAAPGNPFSGTGADPRIWSWGHRNVQGIDWDNRGRLWASELGENAWDELNLIGAGRNYGWPICEGPDRMNTTTACTDSRFTKPVHWWRPADMSPSGIEVDGEHLYMGALRGQSLWQTWVNGGTPRRLLQNSYGRLRSPVRAADGRLFVVTSNGTNDKILLLDPAGWRTAIEQKYRQLGGLRGPLRAPQTGEYCGLRAGGCFERYDGGHLYWSPGTGAHNIWGAIYQRWAGLGWETGRLGYPTSDEFCGLRDGGCGQRLSGGLLYWSPATGSHPVWGAIGQAYADQRWETGRLGYPRGGAEWCGLRDGGCFQEFQGGAIYWSPRSGAWVVLGALRERWAASGWENGPWGYPVGNEACEPRHCWQSFQGGVMHLRW